MNSTIKMPCLVMSPTSVMSPICEYTLSEPPLHCSASSAPIMDSGTDTSDDQRVDEALELRGQHQEDEHQRQHEDHAQRPLRALELARGAVQVGGVAGLEHLAAVSSMNFSASPSE